ncbi:MAG TPA: HrpB1 family type III secretion system apparatus protein [Burkholderiaceae bacterium]|nr:HrpB1 family type III secretion system apparatus protein [Burkholderiaceae bacterium]
MNVAPEAPLFNGMLALVTAAMKWGVREDAAVVISGLRAARPDMVELQLLEGQLAARSGRFRDAIRLLREIESSPTHWSQAKALMASCQVLVGDPEWERHVNEILASPNASADAIASARRLKNRQPSVKGNDQPAVAAASAESEVSQWTNFHPGYIRA